MPSQRAERTWATLGHRKAPRGDIRRASVFASVSGKFGMWTASDSKSFLALSRIVLLVLLQCFLALLEDDHRVEAQAPGLVSYPDPDSHSCGWITSPLRGKRVWRTAVLNSVHGHQNVGEPIRFEVCNNSLLTRVY
eukprot:Em0014g732a